MKYDLANGCDLCLGFDHFGKLEAAKNFLLDGTGLSSGFIAVSEIHRAEIGRSGDEHFRGVLPRAEVGGITQEDRRNQ